MAQNRELHPDFKFYLQLKDEQVIDHFADLRTFILSLYPQSNELLYHTHALTTVFSISAKLSDAFCLIPIYTNHLNLGFNKGTLLDDPHRLLKGTGKLMRHIPVNNQQDYRNKNVEDLIKAAIDFAIADMDKKSKDIGKTFSKIKRG
ncbi:MAG: hypothetical protein DHS20C18_47320 [Saprospiraceae bacterium]|nr:MAG: hypothetical protein DHS20C18_47320 [Saprospiraceae bacterium]